MRDYPDEFNTEKDERKPLTTVRLKHSDVPGLINASPGAPMKVTMEGIVHSNSGKNDLTEGEAEMHVHSIFEHDDEESDGKENAANMPMDKLKDKLPKGE